MKKERKGRGSILSINMEEVERTMLSDNPTKTRYGRKF